MAAEEGDLRPEGAESELLTLKQTALTLSFVGFCLCLLSFVMLMLQSEASISRLSARGAFRVASRRRKSGRLTLIDPV